MNLPENHTERLERVRLSLEGLAVGDAFGEMLAYNCASARQRVERGLMGGPWFHTDDTEMALAIYEVLRRFGRIDADELALRFAERFRKDPDRGYGNRRDRGALRGAAVHSRGLAGGARALRHRRRQMSVTLLFQNCPNPAKKARAKIFFQS
jgi:ADP-ribosylglycohydrolase